MEARQEAMGSEPAGERFGIGSSGGAGVGMGMGKGNKTANKKGAASNRGTRTG